MIFEAEYFEVQGPVLIKPKVFADERGYFFESFAQKDLAKIGIDQPFLQDNQAYSHKGTLRGLHFQKIHMPKANWSESLPAKCWM